MVNRDLGQCPTCGHPLRARTTESGIGYREKIAVCDVCRKEHGDEWIEYNHVWYEPKPKPVRHFARIMAYGSGPAAATITLFLKWLGVR